MTLGGGRRNGTLQAIAARVCPLPPGGAERAHLAQRSVQPRPAAMITAMTR